MLAPTPGEVESLLQKGRVLCKAFRPSYGPGYFHRGLHLGFQLVPKLYIPASTIRLGL